MKKSIFSYWIDQQYTSISEKYIKYCALCIIFKPSCKCQSWHMMCIDLSNVQSKEQMCIDLSNVQSKEASQKDVPINRRWCTHHIKGQEWMHVCLSTTFFSRPVSSESDNFFPPAFIFTKLTMYWAPKNDEWCDESG